MLAAWLPVGARTAGLALAHMSLITSWRSLIKSNSVVRMRAVRGSTCSGRGDHTTARAVADGRATPGCVSSRDALWTSLWQRLVTPDRLRLRSRRALETWPWRHESYSPGEPASGPCQICYLQNVADFLGTLWVCYEFITFYFISLNLIFELI